MKNLQAVLFCGGKGTRLYPFTDYYQKVMMPIGKEGKPVIEHIISKLISFGVTKFLALVSYRGNLVRRYLGDGSDYNVEIEYIFDNPKFKGTGGALYNARDSITAENILIYYTDIISKLSIKDFYNFHLKHGKVATVWSNPDWENHVQRVDLGANGMILNLNNKLPENIYVNSGLSIVKKDIFKIMEAEFISKGVYDIDLSATIFPNLVGKKELVNFKTEDSWIDIGRIDRYEYLKENLSKFN